MPNLVRVAYSSQKWIKTSLTFLKWGAGEIRNEVGILWFWLSREGSSRSSFVFYLTILLPFRHLHFFFPHLSSVLHPFLYTTLLQGEGKNQCVTTEVFNKRTLKGQSKTGILSLIKFVSYIWCELTHGICSMHIRCFYPSRWRVSCLW